MGTVKGLLDGYLPLDAEDVLDDVGFTIQLDPRPLDASVPRHEGAWVGRCRRISAARLHLWGLPAALVNDVLLVVSELATNALRYGTVLGFRLIVTTEKVGVVVTDGSVRMPRVRQASADEETGRGMLLVQTFADAWGVRPDGMATWCTFTIPERQS
ncbi:ATP-binding protein [Streptomyces venezuelae]|uniref:ATP-binding protein n=1 Tax=Streptomyces venezuelae TaxID=54571 RepID=UPI00364CC2A9